MALACGFFRVIVSGAGNSGELNRRLAPARLIFVAIRESKWRTIRAFIP